MTEINGTYKPLFTLIENKKNHTVEYQSFIFILQIMSFLKNNIIKKINTELVLAPLLLLLLRGNSLGNIQVSLTSARRMFERMFLFEFPLVSAEM